MTDPRFWVRRWFEAKGPLPAGNPDSVNYFETGLIDSLAVVGLVADIEKTFGVRFEDRHYQEPRFSTVGGLGELIAELMKTKAAP